MPDAIEAVIRFIRAAGVSEDDLLNKRSYRSEDLPKGVWATKNGQYVVKLPAGGEGKHKRAKTAEQAMELAALASEPSAAALCDQEVHDQHGVGEGDIPSPAEN